ncbi:MAG: hypothetical protein FWB83_02335 [Treponema sp.]|nr:hypothetical protein [Treponema sp.]
MGIMIPYFPKDMVIKLAEISKADTFIETGTHYGGTSKWASTQFKKVHTIELSEFIFNKTKDELLSYGNISPYLGDSSNLLSEILKNIDSNLVFWLDGHYAGGGTAGIDNPCPLLKEIEIIIKRKNEDIIVIDDARCLLEDTSWPSLYQLYKKIETTSVEKKFILSCDDNIYIIPDQDKYKEPLLQYSLERNVILWKQDYDIRNPSIKKSFVKILKKLRLYNFCRSIYKSFKK